MIGRKAAPPESISQTIYPVQWGDKEAMLLEILSKPEVQSAIVFTRTRVRPSISAGCSNATACVPR